jgi:hypothetical protein
MNVILFLAFSSDLMNYYFGESVGVISKNIINKEVNFKLIFWLGTICSLTSCTYIMLKLNKEVYDI